MSCPGVVADKAQLRLGFRISGRTRDDWQNLVAITWYRPDLRDSVPPVLHLPNGDNTISPVRMCLNVLAGYDELDWRARNLWVQGFWSDEHYEAALESNEAGRRETRTALASAHAWESKRRAGGDV
jgi:hypothetical protein